MENENNAVNPAAYDAEMRQTYPFYDEFHRQIIETVRVHCKEPVSWLDIGSGTGTLAARAFQSLPVSKMICCEHHAALLDAARLRLPHSQTVFMQKNILHLALRERFDVITAVQSLHTLTMEEREQTVRSCYEKLRPNGIFLTFENILPFSQTGTDYAMILWTEYQKRMGKTDARCEAFLADYREKCRPVTISEQLSLLRRCGFEIAELLWCSGMQAGFYGIRTAR